MALRTRSGVSTRPSRVAFSPRRTIISRTRSSKLALVSVADSVGAGFMGPLASTLCRLSRDLGVAGVLERIHHRFFESYSFKMRPVKAPVQYFVDLNTEIFRGRHELGEFLQGIQI